MGRGLPTGFLLIVVFLSDLETISPGLEVPEARVLTIEPEGHPDYSQGLGEGTLPANIFNAQKIEKFEVLKNIRPDNIR